MEEGRKKKEIVLYRRCEAVELGGRGAARGRRYT